MSPRTFDQNVTAETGRDFHYSKGLQRSAGKRKNVVWIDRSLQLLPFLVLMPRPFFFTLEKGGFCHSSKLGWLECPQTKMISDMVVKMNPLGNSL